MNDYESRAAVFISLKYVLRIYLKEMRKSICQALNEHVVKAYDKMEV